MSKKIYNQSDLMSLQAQIEKEKQAEDLPSIITFIIIAVIALTIMSFFGHKRTNVDYTTPSISSGVSEVK